MDEQVGPGKPFRSLMQWAKRAKMSPSTLHSIYNRGSADLDNIVRLARAAHANPKTVLIRIGVFDEELPDDDIKVRRFKEALALLPEESQELAADMAVAIIERLLGHQGQQAARTHLRLVDRQESEDEPKP